MAATTDATRSAGLVTTALVPVEPAVTARSLLKSCASRRAFLMAPFARLVGVGVGVGVAVGAGVGVATGVGVGVGMGVGTGVGAGVGVGAGPPASAASKAAKSQPRSLPSVPALR